jgi:hypothetical protein
MSGGISDGGFPRPPDQLHRRQPAARLIPRVPGERGQPVHRYQPAVLPGEDAPTRGDLGRPAGSDGRGSWLSIRVIIHVTPPG